jgi:hypothetical protein
LGGSRAEGEGIGAGRPSPVLCILVRTGSSPWLSSAARFIQRWHPPLPLTLGTPHTPRCRAGARRPECGRPRRAQQRRAAPLRGPRQQGRRLRPCPARRARRQAARGPRPAAARGQPVTRAAGRTPGCASAGAAGAGATAAKRGEGPRGAECELCGASKHAQGGCWAAHNLGGFEHGGAGGLQQCRRSETVTCPPQPISTNPTSQPGRRLAIAPGRLRRGPRWRRLTAGPRVPYGCLPTRNLGVAALRAWHCALDSCVLRIDLAVFAFSPGRGVANHGHQQLGFARPCSRMLLTRGARSATPQEAACQLLARALDAAGQFEGSGCTDGGALVNVEVGGT